MVKKMARETCFNFCRWFHPNGDSALCNKTHRKTSAETTLPSWAQLEDCEWKRNGALKCAKTKGLNWQTANHDQLIQDTKALNHPFPWQVVKKDWKLGRVLCQQLIWPVFCSAGNVATSAVTAGNFGHRICWACWFDVNICKDDDTRAT